MGIDLTMKEEGRQKSGSLNDMQSNTTSTVLQHLNLSFAVIYDPEQWTGLAKLPKPNGRRF